MFSSTKQSRNLAKMLLLTVLFSAIGCQNKNVKPEKPFIITFKYPNSPSASVGFCRYEYFDKQGLKYKTFDTNNKYNLGDTIK